MLKIFRQVSRPPQVNGYRTEHLMEHVFGQPFGPGVVTAAMETVEQGQAVCKPVARTPIYGQNNCLFVH